MMSHGQKRVNSSALCSVRTISGSIPFPVDEVPVRQYKSTKAIDSQDPDSYRPKADGIHVNLILKEATCKGWLKKHKKPMFVFKNGYKKRYVVLVDRMLYTFKSETPNTYREYFEITAETKVYLSDRFSEAAYYIEVSKKISTGSGFMVWLLQTEEAEIMKTWLSYLKGTVDCLRRGHQGHITRYDLSVPEKDSGYHSLSKSNQAVCWEEDGLDRPPSPCVSLTLIDTVCSDTARLPSRLQPTLSSLAFYHKKVFDHLPPQPPPPTSHLPPIPRS